VHETQEVGCDKKHSSKNHNEFIYDSFDYLHNIESLVS